METGAVTTAITLRSKDGPRSISILRCLEEPQMIINVEESQSVVMQKSMPDFKRLPQRWAKKERGKKGKAKSKNDKQHSAQNLQNCRAPGSFTSFNHSSSLQN